MMRAAMLMAPGQMLENMSIETPRPGPGELLVKVDGRLVIDFRDSRQ